MLTLLFIFLMVAVFGELITFAFKMAWGLTKILFAFILLPFVLIGLVIMGMIYLAIPILVIIGLVSLIAGLLD